MKSLTRGKRWRDESPTALGTDTQGKRESSALSELRPKSSQARQANSEMPYNINTFQMAFEYSTKSLTLSSVHQYGLPAKIYGKKPFKMPARPFIGRSKTSSIRLRQNKVNTHRDTWKMKTIYTQLIKQLQAKVPALRWIDLNTGQLDYLSLITRDLLSLPCCVLIDISVDRTTALTDTLQECQATITLTIADDHQCKPVLTPTSTSPRAVRASRRHLHCSARLHRRSRTLLPTQSHPTRTHPKPCRSLPLPHKLRHLFLDLTNQPQ